LPEADSRAILCAAEKMIACDACGCPADPQHVRERIERLELATRFRPVHIRVLLIDAAPPVRPEDYFYRVAEDRSVRSEVSRGYFDELLKCVGSPRGAEDGEESGLTDFQRSGFFLAYAVECPIQNSSELEEAVRRAAPAVVKRVQLSYKPKFIALLSRGSGELIPSLQTAGLNDSLILDDGKPFAGPSGDSSVTSAVSGSRFGDRLADALARLP
jgi:hypothetical protein